MCIQWTKTNPGSNSCRFFFFLFCFFFRQDGDIGMAAEKRVSSVWTDEETLALIEIWGEEDVQRSLRGFVHNGYVYAEISERMQDLGYSKTPEQCRWKVKSLRNNFRQCYDKKK